jgi:hypothetical protein
MQAGANELSGVLSARPRLCVQCFTLLGADESCDLHPKAARLDLRLAPQRRAFVETAFQRRFNAGPTNQLQRMFGAVGALLGRSRADDEPQHSAAAAAGIIAPHDAPEVGFGFCMQWHTYKVERSDTEGGGIRIRAGDGGKIILRDALCSGFDVDLETGQRVHIRAGRIRLEPPIDDEFSMPPDEVHDYTALLEVEGKVHSALHHHIRGYRVGLCPGMAISVVTPGDRTQLPILQVPPLS